MNCSLYWFTHVFCTGVNSSSAFFFLWLSMCVYVCVCQVWATRWRCSVRHWAIIKCCYFLTVFHDSPTPVMHCQRSCTHWSTGRQPDSLLWFCYFFYQSFVWSTDNECVLGRLFDRVDFIKPVSNVRPSLCTYVGTYVHMSIRPQKVSSISMKFGM